MAECDPIEERFCALGRRRGATGRQSAYLVKLTDSSLKALKEARKSGLGANLRITLPSDAAQAGIFDMGQAGRYQLKVSDLRRDLGQGGAMDVLTAPAGCRDGCGPDGAPRLELLAPLHSRVQFQATEESFSETRQKALQLVEQEQKNSSAKELKQKGLRKSKHHHGHSSSSSSSKRPTAPTPTSMSSRPPPPRPALASSGAAVAPSVPKKEREQPTTTTTINPKLMAKPLRQRVIHTLAIRGYTREVLEERLRREGLTDSDARILDTVLLDVADVYSGSSPNKYMLKSDCFQEVDMQWPFYQMFDRNMVKRAIDDNQQRRAAQILKTRSRPTAPVRPPLPKVPSPTTGSTSVSPPSGQSILDTLLPTSRPPKPTTITAQHQPQPKQDLKRKGPTPPYHADFLGTVTPPMEVHESKEKDGPPPAKLHKGVSPSGRSPPSLAPQEESEKSKNLVVIPPIQPSQDWSKVFHVIETHEERMLYTRLFHGDYAEYCKLHDRLADVARKFTQLEKRLNKEPKGTKEHKKIEREIYTTFKHYMSDAEFMRCRQRHEELKSKLAVLKDRVKVWDRNCMTSARCQSTARNASTHHNSSSTALVETNAGFDDLTVM